MKVKAWLKKRGKNSYPYLFPHRLKAGEPMSIDRLKFMFKEYAVKAGLKPAISVHSLRHTCAVMLAARGASPIRISKWLRQKRVASAEKYFNHVKFADTNWRLAVAFKDIL
jgi:integrase